jgi:LmbE family N-acetylglucosaminyl deacetylase
LSLPPVDLLVFAPHPDDDAIGVGGVIQQALAARKKVRIVFATSGDGYPRAASALLKKPIPELGPPDYVILAATRQREATAAGSLLGLDASSLLFLGYPDAAMTAVYANESRSPVKSPYTGRHSTYGPAYTDYHMLTHGQPGAYARSSALADVVEILRDSTPAQVYVTDPADTHPDHVATFELVAAAATAIDYAGELLTFVVHSGAPECWPWPHGATPLSRFEQHVIDGMSYPIGAHWPPPIHVPLTTAECALKLQAVAAHASQCAIDREYLESFVKAEEIFWRPSL